MRWRLLAILALAGCEKRLIRGLQPSLVPSANTALATPPIDAQGWYLRGMYDESKGALDEAEEAVQMALRLDPTNGPLHVAIGEFELRQGRLDAAAGLATDALATTPPPARAHYLRAEVLVRQGRDAEARPELVAAVDGGVGSDARQALVALELRNNDPVAARNAYDAWTEPHLHGFDALSRAELGLDIGEGSRAVDDLLDALKDPQVPPDAATMLLKAAQGSCRLGTAWGWALDTGAGWSPDPRWREAALAIARAARDPELMRLAIQGLPEQQDPAVAAELAGLLLPGRPAVAKDALAPALAAHPQDPGLLRLSRAADQAQAGHTAAAAKLLGAGTEPVWAACKPDALVKSARTLPPEDAIPLLQRAIDADPMDMEALHALTAAYDAAGVPPPTGPAP